MGKKPSFLNFVRQHVDKVMGGTYVCNDCKEKVGQSNAVSHERPQFTVKEYSVSFGAYFGRGDKSKYMIRLAKGGKCTVQGASAGFKDDDLEWLIEGSYAEN